MSMPERFTELAEYNARVSKGIAHTPEYRERMAALQREFDTWQSENAEAYAPIIEAIKVATGGLLALTFGSEPVRQQVNLLMDGKIQDPAVAAALRARLAAIPGRLGSRL